LNLGQEQDLDDGQVQEEGQGVKLAHGQGLCEGVVQDQGHYEEEAQNQGQHGQLFQKQFRELA
jgi:hypothetical protein